MSELVQVTAPHFCAGMVISADDYVIEAAPILRWAVGKRRPELRDYFRRRGWKAVLVAPTKAEQEP